AGRAALVDVAEQTRATDLPSALEDAVATGTHREDPQQRVQRLADRPRVRIRAEVLDATTLCAPHDLSARIFLVERHRQPRVGLVVAVADVEPRVELLDPAVFQ